MELSKSIGQAAYAATGRGQDASKTGAHGKDAESMVKYGGRVSARLRTQLLGEARMLAQQKLMARMQKVISNTGARYPPGVTRSHWENSIC